MKRILEFLPALLVGLVLLGAGPATAVTVQVGTAAGQVGDTVLLPVTITGLADDVYAYELVLTWSATYAQCTGAVTGGTLSSGWIVTTGPGAGTVTVAGASAVPLGGDGLLIQLQMLLGPNAGNPTVTLATALLNEGDPVPTRINGQLQISALPVVDIYPDSGILAVGDSLTFNANGGVGPYTFTAENPAVADFAGNNRLYALAPGTTRATAEDTGGYTGTTTGVIEVRAFRLHVVDTIVTEGDTALVPVELVDPAGYGITAGEVKCSWNAAAADFIGIETTGTIAAAAGWGPPTVAAGSGQVTVAMAGIDPLAGPGVLFYLKVFPHASTGLTLVTNIFNETYPALPVNGTLTRTALPTIGLTPSTANLRIGDQLQFTVTGSPTAPVVWSTDDPALATISPSGLLLALGEGLVRVTAVDAAGATAQSGLVRICSLGLPPLSSSIGASETVLVPVTASRTLDELDIYSYEIRVTYSSAYVQFQGVVTAGSVSAGWGAATAVDDGNAVRVYHAGAQKLTGCGPALFFLEFTGLPGLSSPYTGVSLSTSLFNEGAPCALLNAGTPCEDISAVPEAGRGLQLWPNQPNPFNPSTTIRYRLDVAGEADLAVFSARGEHVRQLVRGWRAGGVEHAVRWDGRDDDGRSLASGVYYYRLRSGPRAEFGKMVLLR